MKNTNHFLFLLVYLFVPNLALALNPIKEMEDRRIENSADLQTAATSSDVGMRLSVAWALGRIQLPSSAPLLIQLSKDSAPAVRNTAVFALGQLGWEKNFSGDFYELISNRLIEISFNLNLAPSERIIALEALGKMGMANADEILYPLLKATEDPEVLAELLMAIYRSRFVQRMQDPNFKPSPLSESQFNLFSLIFSSDGFSSSKSLQRNMAFFFARTKEPRALQLLAPLLKSTDSWIRYYSIQAISKVALPDSIPLLLESLNDEDSWNRVAAIDGLKAAKGGKELFEKYPPHLAKKATSFQVRLQYLVALEDLETLTQSEIKPFLRDPSAQVRGQAYTMILKHKWDAWQQSIEFGMLDPSWPVRLATIEAISGFSPPEKTALHHGTQDVNVLVRAAALTGLGKVAEPFVIKYLDKSLQSNQLVERSTAAELLAQRNDPEKFSLAKRTYLASQDFRWKDLRESLLDIFSSTATEESTELLKSALQDPVPAVVAKAKGILVERGIQMDFPEIESAPLSFSPYRELQFEKDPLLKWTTSKGSFVVQLFHDKASIHVANIMGYARDGKYNNTIWHRVVPNFVVQGGDPDGTGWGDAGYSLRAEINQEKFERGSLGMPRSNSFDSGGVQVFFNHVPTPTLDGLYTVFGKIVSGITVIDRLELGDVVYKVEEVTSHFKKL